MSAVAGRILLMPKGDYSSQTVYNSLDWVRYNNAAWVCTTNNTSNVPPSTSATQWTLLAADSAMSNIGDLNDVSISGEVNGQYLGCVIDTSQTPPVITWENVSAATSYSSTGTVPISGTGVADALTNYYTKADIELNTVARYGGTKTAVELTASPNPLLVEANAGKFFRSTEDFVSTSDYVQGTGHYFETGSHIAVIEVSAGVYKFDDFGGFAGVDEWHVYNGGIEEIVENSSTGSKTVVFHGIQSTDAFIPFADTPDGRVVKFSNPTFNGTANTYTFTANVTVLPTKFRLRMIR